MLDMEAKPISLLYALMVVAPQDEINPVRIFQSTLEVANSITVDVFSQVNVLESRIKRRV
jgi:hypothetical protein